MTIALREYQNMKTITISLGNPDFFFFHSFHFSSWNKVGTKTCCSQSTVGITGFSLFISQYDMSVIVRDLRELQSVYLVGIWCVWNQFKCEGA